MRSIFEKKTRTVQVLREILYMRGGGNTCRAQCGRSTHDNRRMVVDFRPSWVRRVGVMPTGFSMAASLLARSWLRTLP